MDVPANPICKLCNHPSIPKVTQKNEIMYVCNTGCMNPKRPEFPYVVSWGTVVIRNAPPPSPPQSSTSSTTPSQNLEAVIMALSHQIQKLSEELKLQSKEIKILREMTAAAEQPEPKKRKTTKQKHYQSTEEQ